MATQKKLGTPRGVSEWQRLETVGDVKRFLRWCTLSMREQTLDTRNAAVLAFLGMSLLRAIKAERATDRPPLRGSLRVAVG